MTFDPILDVMIGFSAKIGSIVPLGRGYFPHQPRHFVPGYYRAVPPGQKPPLGRRSESTSWFRDMFKPREMSSSKEQTASEDGGDYPDQISEQSGGNGVPRFGDADRAKINRYYVKGGFGAAVNRCRRVTEDVVRAKLLYEIG
jgi:hypothetical protein